MVLSKNDAIGKIKSHLAKKQNAESVDNVVSCEKPPFFEFKGYFSRSDGKHGFKLRIDRESGNVLFEAIYLHGSIKGKRLLC